MKGIVIFDTTYGNTRKIAETISGTLKESGIEVDAVYVKDVKKLSPLEYHFMVLGSPTRFGTMSFAVKGFLNKVNSEAWMNKPFVAFDTQTFQSIEKQEGCAADKIAEKLKDKHMKQLLPALKAIVSDNLRCSLKEGEIQRAKEYAERLAIELKR